MLPNPYDVLIGDGSYADYVAATRRRLEAVHPNWPERVAAAMPFELAPGEGRADTGVLLFHGLLSSPFDQRELASKLVARGYRVRVPLLPDHGETPESLLDADLNHWLAATRAQIDAFSREVGTLLLGGYSVGAALALHHATSDNLSVAAILALAPSLDITHLTGVDKRLQRLAWAFPRLHWARIEPETDYARYRSVAVASGFAVARLGTILRKRLYSSPLDIPCFTVMSLEDLTVKAHPILEFYRRQADPRHRLLLYHRTPIEVTDQRITLQPAGVDDARVIDMSHTAFPFSLGNSHYGEGGDLIEQPSTALAPWHRGTEPVYGEISLANRWRYNLYRSHRNPHFDGMCDAILSFFDANL